MLVSVCQILFLRCGSQNGKQHKVGVTEYCVLVLEVTSIMPG